MRAKAATHTMRPTLSPRPLPSCCFVSQGRTGMHVPCAVAAVLRQPAVCAGGGLISKTQLTTERGAVICNLHGGSAAFFANRNNGRRMLFRVFQLRSGRADGRRQRGRGQRRKVLLSKQLRRRRLRARRRRRAHIVAHRSAALQLGGARGTSALPYSVRSIGGHHRRGGGGGGGGGGDGGGGARRARRG